VRLPPRFRLLGRYQYSSARMWLLSHSRERAWCEWDSAMAQSVSTARQYRTLYGDTPYAKRRLDAAIEHRDRWHRIDQAPQRRRQARTARAKARGRR
jgi:hypothetical protein